MNDVQFPNLYEAELYKLHAIAVPVEFNGGSGMTLEMSARNVRFETMAPLIPGAVLELVFYFPTNKVRVRAQGRMLRVQGRTDGSELNDVTAEFKKISFS